MKIVVVVISIIALMFLGGVFLLGSYVYLSVPNTVVVYASLDASVNDGDTIAELTPGEDVVVVSCHDVKHYLVPEVILPTGEHGFINGNYSLRKERVGFSLKQKVVFSC